VKSLIEAEVRARQIVTDAKNAKDGQAQEAETEAGTINTKHRQELQEAYAAEIEKKEQEKEGLVVLESRVAEDIESTKQLYEKNKDAVVDMLMKHICNIDLEVPKVVKQEFTREE